MRKGGIDLDMRIVLFGIIFIVLMTDAVGYCTTMRFSQHDEELNAYDNSGLFVGYNVCFDVSNTGFDSSTIGSGSLRLKKKLADVGELYEFEVEIYQTAADAAKELEFDDIYGDVRESAFGYMDIQGHNATYRTYTMKTGERVDSMDGRPYNVYSYYGDLRYLIDPLTVFNAHISRHEIPAQDEFVRIFESLNVSRIEEENPRHLTTVGNQLFEQGKYEDAIAAYDKIAEFNTRAFHYETNEVIDNKGFALLKLGRNNEAVAWFDKYDPSSSNAWEVYGQLLQSMGLGREAEYAFDKANDAR